MITVHVFSGSRVLPQKVFVTYKCRKTEVRESIASPFVTVCHVGAAHRLQRKSDWAHAPSLDARRSTLPPPTGPTAAPSREGT
jgi:hypothetical protein